MTDGLLKGGRRLFDIMTVEGNVRNDLTKGDPRPLILCSAQREIIRILSILFVNLIFASDDLEKVSMPC